MVYSYVQKENQFQWKVRNKYELKTCTLKRSEMGENIPFFNWFGTRFSKYSTWKFVRKNYVHNNIIIIITHHDVVS